MDVLFGAGDEEGAGKTDDRVQEHQTSLQKAHQHARRELERAAEARYRLQGPPSQNSVQKVNQLVYRKNHEFGGRHKIQDIWMPVPFHVVAQPDPSKPVYNVAPIDGSQPPKNFHRQELCPCGPEQCGGTCK